jgi:demethylmenaquinone methyltransferase/2-methoxy-6-polyprenyl-1,4-benzoquinol methylase
LSEPLRAALATPEGKRRYVRRLFSRIADRYDLITILLSYGRDRRWKARVADLAAVRFGERALDLACGTGDIAFAIAARGARVVALDVTPRMIALASRKAGRGSAVRMVVGDMMALPLADRGFDLVTVGYGLRNVPELRGALEEIRRVLAPGGRLISLDFNRPAHPVVRAVYLFYLTVVGSAIGLALHGDADTYRYIAETVRRYPGAEAVAAAMRDIGFAPARVEPVLGGLMAIHYAVRYD